MNRAPPPLLKRLATSNAVASTYRSIPTPPLVSLSRLCFSSQSHPPADATPPLNPTDDDALADVSTEELKQRIETYNGGDVDAIPSIFEAILARKLSGKHKESDDELMNELLSKKSPCDKDDNIDMSESNDDYSSESDDEH